MTRMDNSSFDAKLYRERRAKGLRGQIGFANVHIVSEDEKGNPQLIPVGYMRGSGQSSRMQRKESNKVVDRRNTKKGYTHVIKIINGKPVRIPAKIGSKLHGLALSNVRKARRRGKAEMEKPDAVQGGNATIKP